MSTKQEQHRCHCGSWDYQHVEGTGRCLITDCECKAFQSRAAMNEEITVESASKELWEMFGDKRDYEIRLRSWGYKYLIHVATNAGLRMDFKADTLKEAMDQVRDWKAQQ